MPDSDPDPNKSPFHSLKRTILLKTGYRQQKKKTRCSLFQFPFPFSSIINRVCTPYKWVYKRYYLISGCMNPVFGPENLRVIIAEQYPFHIPLCHKYIYALMHSIHAEMAWQLANVVHVHRQAPVQGKWKLMVHVYTREHVVLDAKTNEIAEEKQNIWCIRKYAQAFWPKRTSWMRMRKNSEYQTIRCLCANSPIWATSKIFNKLQPPAPSLNRPECAQTSSIIMPICVAAADDSLFFFFFAKRKSLFVVLKTFAATVEMKQETSKPLDVRICVRLCYTKYRREKNKITGDFFCLCWPVRMDASEGGKKGGPVKLDAYNICLWLAVYRSHGLFFRHLCDISPCAVLFRNNSLRR